MLSLQLGLEMGALPWELRAAMSLLRLRKCQSSIRAAELVEARKLLHNLYKCFTEGFSFPDLKDAAALFGLSTSINVIKPRSTTRCSVLRGDLVYIKRTSSL